MRCTLLFLSVAATLTVAAPGPGWAQFGQSISGDDDRRAIYGGTPVDALPSPFSHGGTCVKRCREDMTPCDPDYWKTVDHRCATGASQH